MDLLGKTFRASWWLLFGKFDAEDKRRIAGALEIIAREGKDFIQHIDVTATKDGLTIKYKREF